MVEAQRPAAEAKGIRLEAIAGAPVEVDAERGAMRTLMENLVDNAIRYTDQGSVTVRAYPGVSGAVFFSNRASTSCFGDGS